MLLQIEDTRATLFTRATPAVMAVLPRLEGRRSWLKGGGLSVESTGHNISVLSGIAGVVVKDLRGLGAVVAGGSFEPPLGNPTYKSLTSAYDHQNQAKEKMVGRNAFALFMEQGTGKTKVLIDWAGELFCSGQITGVLVVSKKGVHRQWIESEIPKHLGIPHTGAFWPIKAVPDALAPGDRLKWLAFNYDGIKTPTGLAAARRFCSMHRNRLLIIADESQEIKNHRSVRAAAMTEVKAYSSHRALASGTPIAKDLTDEWAQLKWLDESILGVKYLTAFRTEYCVMGGYEGKVVIGHRNIARFKALVEPYTFRATKDGLVLPKQHNEWVFDLAPEQKKAIKQLRDSLLVQIDNGEIVSAATAAVAISKVQQASSGFVIDEEGKAHLLLPTDRNPRIKAALEWLDAGEGKAIVWIRFRQDAVLLAEALEKAGVSFVQYHGGTSDKDRSAAVASFMDPEGAQVFLANPQSAGTGLNLQGLCRRALYYTNSFSAIDRWQSEDRIHRIGTVGAVVYTDLIAKGSIDRSIIANLRRKQGIADMALGDIRNMIEEL